MSNKRQQSFLVKDLIKWLQAQDPFAAVYAISVRDGRGGSRVSIEPYHPATSHNPIEPDVLLGTWEEVDNLDSSSLTGLAYLQPFRGTWEEVDNLDS